MWLSVTILDQPTRGANFKAKNLSAWVVFLSNQSLGSNMKIIGVIWPVCPIFIVDQVDRFYRCSHGITSTWPLAPHFPRGVVCPSFSAMPGRPKLSQRWLVLHSRNSYAPPNQTSFAHVARLGQVSVVGPLWSQKCILPSGAMQ